MVRWRHHMLSQFERWWLEAWPHRLHIRTYLPGFLKEAPQPFRGEVLEVGAGSGWSSRRILETFPQVELTATDVDPHAVESLERLRGQYGQRLFVRQADARDLPFDRAKFDWVLGLHLLRHVPEKDVRQAFTELLRVVRPGGFVGIVDEGREGGWRLLDAFRPRRHRHTRSEVIDLLGSLEAQVVYADGEAHFGVWAKKPYPFSPERT